ncbi:MAG: patatin-like phospholipase family protein [Bacillota bacterium]|jgi:hypothetical protein
MAFAVKGGACFVFSLSNARGSEFAHVRERVARHREQAARRGPSVGIALSSGAARGLAHIGVLTALEQAGIEIDLIAGCSMDGQDSFADKPCTNAGLHGHNSPNKRPA